MGEFFDSGARFASAVNRINSRMKTIAEKVGKMSTAYQDLSTEISNYIPYQYQRFSDGILQIAKPRTLYKEDSYDIEKFINISDKEMETYSDIKKAYEPKYEELKRQFEQESEEGFGDVSTEEDFSIEEFIRANESLNSALPVLYENMQSDKVEKALNIMSIEGRRKTYKELNEVISIAELYTI